jgi:trans-2,3-dihydro-3-hydroxyanthranilate isomerase
MNDTLPFYLVDVFAENKLEGNQLAVFDQAGELSTETMQAIAKETNLAETTFITAHHKGSFDVRIFTTENEMPFAGHPTIGTAAVIAQKILKDSQADITLNLKIGPVKVEQKPDMYQFSLKNGSIISSIEKPQLAQMLEIELDKIGQYPCEVSSTGYPFLIVHIADLTTLKSLSIAPSKMLEFLLANNIHKSKTPYGTTVGVFCFCLEAQNPENDMHSRMLLLQDNTVLEDPATGAAHTAFAHYAYVHGIFGDAFQKRSEQGFEIGRPSILHIGALADGTVSLGGKVQFVASGVWEV